MPPCKCRYDAWGNSILPHSEMLLYYKQDENSLKILKNHLPHRFVIIPDVEIRISPEDSTNVLVYLIYPGRTESKSLYTTPRVLFALRKTFRGRKGWTREVKKNNVVILRHRGRVMIEPSGKFYAKPIRA